MRGLSRFADKHSGALIERGTFTPATIITPRMAEVMARKHRWGIHFNMDTFDGICFVSPWGANIPPPTTFNIPNIDFNGIVDDAHECHIKIAYINAYHETGFSLWPSEITAKMYEIEGGAHLTPYYPSETYNVGDHADNNIVAKFCATMKREDIEPWLYVNFSTHWNMMGSYGGALGAPPAYGTHGRAEWVLYCCLLCQELLLKYGPYGLKGLWVDAYMPLERAEYVQLYNAIKSIDPNCWVTMNMGPVNGMHNFPGDGKSYEGYVVNNPAITQYQTMDTEIDGVVYQTTNEFIISLASHTSPQNWYYYDEHCRRQPSNPPGVWLSTAQLQMDYNNAVLHGCAFMTSPSLDRYGNIPDGMLTALKALTYQL